MYRGKKVPEIWLGLLAIAALAAFAIACGTNEKISDTQVDASDVVIGEPTRVVVVHDDATQDSKSRPGVISNPADIEKVVITTPDSNPKERSVTITTYDTCLTLNKTTAINWKVVGNEIHIHVEEQNPIGETICAMVITLEDHLVNIGYEYQKGVEYRVIVNGKTHGTFSGG